MIRALAENGLLSIRLLGIASLPYRVEVRLGRLQKVSYETKIKKDPQLRRGLEVIEESGIDGYTVKTLRTFFTLDGAKYREELMFNKADHYLAKPSVVRVGVGTSTTRSLTETNGLGRNPAPTSVFPTEATSDSDLDFEFDFRE
jgi:hypothetical protein